MYLNVLIFFLGIGFVQGVLITLVLLSRKKLQPFHFFLNTYIAVLLLQLLFKVISKLWLLDTWPQAYLTSYFLPFLYGPLLLLFARSYTTINFKWTWQYTLHFIPFLIYMSFYALADPYSYPPSIMAFLIHPFTRFVLQLISIVAYHGVVLKMVHEAVEENHSKTVLRTRLIFLRTFSVASAFVSMAISGALLFLYVNYPQ